MEGFPIKHEKDLATVASKDPNDYKDASLAALTVYSLYWLHQWDLRRTIEAVTILNWRLFPDKFAMVGFPEYPDAFRTNRSLLQGQPKYRNWLTGSATQGFSLNDRGIELGCELTAKLGPPATSSGTLFGSLSPVLPKPRRQDFNGSIDLVLIVKQARESRLFEKWAANIMSERDLIHVHSLLGVFDHTPTKVREKAMKDLERSANDVGDQEMVRFLEDVRRTFPEVFFGRRS